MTHELIQLEGAELIKGLSQAKALMHFPGAAEELNSLGLSEPSMALWEEPAMASRQKQCTGILRA